MKTVSKSRLKAHMLEIFRDIEKSGKGIIVTDRGLPTLRVEPIQRQHSVNDLFGDLQGKLEYRDDLMSPETEEWPEA